jgi:hypothetical protein
MKSKIARCRAVAALVALFAAACAEQPLAPGRPKGANLDLAPYATYEECADLAVGDRLDYRFESNAPVKFNISYRDSNMIVVPITRDDVIADSGVFAPLLKSRYCLSWEANASGALVDYHAAVRRGAE